MMEVLWINREHPFVLDRIEPIRNDWETFVRNKPKGGVWTSPLDSEQGWKEWCAGEMPCWIQGKRWYRLTIDESNLLIVDSIAKTITLPTISKNRYYEWEVCV